MNTLLGVNPKDALGVLKPQLHLVPPALTIWVAKAMENGAKKFGPYNWRTSKVRMTVYISAAMRHLAALLDGEDVAKDSEVPHAAHAAACLGIILDAIETNSLVDDRPPRGRAGELIARLAALSIPHSTPPQCIEAPLDTPPQCIEQSKCMDKDKLAPTPPPDTLPYFGHHGYF